MMGSRPPARPRIHGEQGRSPRSDEPRRSAANEFAAGGSATRPQQGTERSNEERQHPVPTLAPTSARRIAVARLVPRPVAPWRPRGRRGVVGRPRRHAARLTRRRADPTGDDGLLEAQARGLAQASIEPGTARNSPSRPTSAAASNRAGGDGGHGTQRPTPAASGRSRAGSSTLRTAGQAGVDVLAAQVHARPAAEHRDEQREAAGLDAADAVRRGAPNPPDGATSAWTSTRSGRLPSSVAATAVPGASAEPVAEEGPRGIGHLAQAAAAAISSTPTSSVEPKRFLMRAQEPQRAEALALERAAPRRRGARASWARRASRPW